jgi:hypothetical protein
LLAQQPIRSAGTSPRAQALFRQSRHRPTTTTTTTKYSHQSQTTATTNWNCDGLQQHQNFYQKYSIFFFV